MRKLCHCVELYVDFLGQHGSHAKEHLGLRQSILSLFFPPTASCLSDLDLLRYINQIKVECI